MASDAPLPEIGSEQASSTFSDTQSTRSALSFLKIWHNVFVLNLEYSVDAAEVDLSHLDPALLGNHDICLTGQWLKTQPQEVRALDIYKHLDQLHSSFHALAAEVAKLYHSGNVEAAQALFHGLFSTVSNNVLHAMDAMFLALNGDLADTGTSTASARLKIQPIWDASFEIGDLEVDRRHHAIAMLIEQVLLNADIDCGKVDTAFFLEVLSKMIKQEIAAETPLLNIMNDRGLPGAAEHIEAHRGFLIYLTALHELVAGGAVLSLNEVGNSLASWFIEHLVTYDLELETQRDPK